MIEYYKSTISNPKLRKLREFKIGALIRVYSPNENEIEYLTNKFNLNVELLQEGLDDNELPRLDLDENGNYYIYIKSSHEEENKLITILVIIGHNFILTLSKNKIDELKQIYLNELKIITTQRLKTLIKFLDLIDIRIQESITNVVKNVQQKKKTTKNLKEYDMNILLDYEDYLNNLVSMYYYTSLLYSKITKHLKFFKEDKLMLNDLVVETHEGMNLCKNSLKTITNIRNNYSIILSNKLNKSIQILTIFTIMINIPAAIGSIYGMNIALPFQNSPYAFIYIISLIILLLSIFIIFSKKKQLI